MKAMKELSESAAKGRMFNGAKTLFVAAVVTARMLFASSPAAAETSEQLGLLSDIPRDKQIELAMGAAPAEISTHATILVLGPNGYVEVRSGTNGFTCLVERQLLETLEPSCYDAEGSATTLQARLHLEELRAAKVPEDEIARRINDRYQTGTFKAPSKPGFVYMLSPHNKVHNDRTNRIIRVPPHLMFYVPYATEKDFGGFVGPHMPYVVLQGRPDAYLIVNPVLMAKSLQQPPNAAAIDPGLHSHGK
jgi:hypothetical protein